MCLGLTLALKHPADFKEFAEVINPKKHIFVKPAREGVAVYNPFTSKHFLLQGERVPKTDTIADLLAKGALVACEPPDKTKEKADDNCFQFPRGLPGQSVEFDASQAGASTQKRRMLVVGQSAAGGSAPAGEAKRVDSVGEIAALFGAGSQVGAMARSAKTAHPTGQVWALPLADAANASKATATITVSASSAKAGANANAIATAIKTALNRAAPALPVVAASPSSANANATANAVTLTCRWGGTTGNQIDLRHSYRQEDTLPSGVSLALTAFSGGATDPDLSTALAALGDTQYHTQPYLTATVLRSARLIRCCKNAGNQRWLRKGWRLSLQWAHSAK